MKKFKYIILILFLTFNGVLANENIKQPSPDYIKNFPGDNFYILGPGDTLSIEVSEDTTALNKVFTINREGIANLVRLKRIYASGLTIGELTDILNKEYSAYVNKPDVRLILLKYKPVKVYIDGEVEDPGLHVLRGSFDPSELLAKNIAEGVTSVKEQIQIEGAAMAPNDK